MDKNKLLNKVKKSVKPQNSKCSCGVEFNCDIEDGKPDCWCFYELAGKSIKNIIHQDCVCQKCLKK